MPRGSNRSPVNSRNPLGSCPGFSLVEATVLSACAMLVLLASVPAVERLHQAWSLRAGTCLVESTLQWGRLHAITANASLMLEVDPAGKSTAWRDPESGSAYDTAACHLPSDVRIVSAPSKPLRFFPRGNAAPAGSYVLKNRAGSYRVVVSPAGRIRVERI